MSLQAPYDHLKSQIDAAERTIANAEGELAEAKKEKNADRAAKGPAGDRKNSSRSSNRSRPNFRRSRSITKSNTIKNLCT